MGLLSLVLFGVGVFAMASGFVMQIVAVVKINEASIPLSLMGLGLMFLGWLNVAISFFHLFQQSLLVALAI